MRTTLTLDPDVAARLEQLRSERGLGLKAAVNAALRAGLEQLTNPRQDRPEVFRTTTVDTGRVLVPDVVCVGSVLAFLDEAEAGSES